MKQTSDRLQPVYAQAVKRQCAVDGRITKHKHVSGRWPKRYQVVKGRVLEPVPNERLSPLMPASEIGKARENATLARNSWKEVVLGNAGYVGESHERTGMRPGDDSIKQKANESLVVTTWKKKVDRKEVSEELKNDAKWKETGMAESRGDRGYDRGSQKDSLWERGGARQMPPGLSGHSGGGEKQFGEGAGGGGGGGGGGDDGSDSGSERPWIPMFIPRADGFRSSVHDGYRLDTGGYGKDMLDWRDTRRGTKISILPLSHNSMRLNTFDDEAAHSTTSNRYNAPQENPPSLAIWFRSPKEDSQDESLDSSTCNRLAAISEEAKQSENALTASAKDGNKGTWRPLESDIAEENQKKGLDKSCWLIDLSEVDKASEMELSSMSTQGDAALLSLLDSDIGDDAGFNLGTLQITVDDMDFAASTKQLSTKIKGNMKGGVLEKLVCALAEDTAMDLD